MARINNYKRYPKKENPKKEDTVIGTCFETGKTMNFSLGDNCGVCGDIDFDEDAIDFFSFQFNNLTDGIANINSIDDNFLIDNGVNHSTESIEEGKQFTFQNVGRYGFLIKNSPNTPYKIFDILNNDVTNITFDVLYNSQSKTFYYISKEYVAPSILYYKFIRQ